MPDSPPPRRLRVRHVAFVLSLFAASLLACLPVAAADFAHNFSGPEPDQVWTTGTAVDAAGNQYLSGYFEGATLVLGNVTLGRIGTRDAFAAKFDAGGNVVWATNFGGNGAYAWGQAIAVDGAGNAYLAGSFNGGAGLTTPPLSTIGNQDAFAVKIDGSGSIVWARQFSGGGAYAYGQAIAVDAQQHVYLSGYFGLGNLTTPALTLTGTADAFAIKLNTDGTTAWARSYGGSAASTHANAIAVDTTGNNVYVAGSFGFGNLTTPAMTRIGFDDAFAFEVDGVSGTTTWARNFGGSNASANGMSIAVDGPGNVYLGGSFNGADLTVPALSWIGYKDAFAIKLSAGGVTTWARNFGGAAATADGQAIAVDPSGDVHLAGTLAGADLTTPVLNRIGVTDAYVIALDPGGVVNSAKTFGGSSAHTTGSGVGVDPLGNVYVAGHFFNARLTTPALTRIGSQDAFVVKLLPAGTIARAGNLGSVSPGGRAYIRATAIDPAGNSYVAGSMAAASMAVGASTLHLLGNTDAFAAKFDPLGNVVWARNFGGGGVTADGQAIAVDAVGNVYIAGTFAFGDMTTPSLPIIGYHDAFAIKLDATGATTWARNFGGNNADAYANAIAVDTSGSVYLGGSSSFNNLTTPPVTRIGVSDALVIKLDAAGATTWAEGYGGSGAYATGRAIAIDGTGNILLGGDFANADLTSPSLPRIGVKDLFALKLAPSGTVTWARNYGGNGVQASGNAITGGNAGTVYLGGSFSQGNLTTPPLALIGYVDGVAIRIDTTGATVWARDFGGSGTAANINAVALDAAGHVYLGGEFHTGNLTTPPVVSPGFGNALAIKLDSAGATTWARAYGGGTTDAFGLAIAADNAGAVYVGGIFLDGGIARPPLSLIGTVDAFIVKGTYFTITYHGNGNTGGTPPLDVTGYGAGEATYLATGGSLVQSGKAFAGWNTAPSGNGTHYDAYTGFVMPAANVDLYAEWAVGAPPTLQYSTSRKTHGFAGTFELLLP